MSPSRTGGEALFPQNNAQSGSVEHSLSRRAPAMPRFRLCRLKKVSRARTFRNRNDGNCWNCRRGWTTFGRWRHDNGTFFSTSLLLFALTLPFQGVKRGQEESDLERIQDLFPGDALRLYDKDALTMRMKGLMRKRSTTASRLQRALSAKRLEPEDQSLPKDGQDKRVFLLETPVQFTTVSARREGDRLTPRRWERRLTVRTVPGSSEPGEALVPLQRPAAGSEGPLRGKFQTEGKGSRVRDMDDAMLHGGCDRSAQESGNFLRYRLADDKRSRYFQVGRQKSSLSFFFLNCWERFER